MPGKRSRTDDAVRVRYRSTKSLPRAEVLRLYRSVQWSAARKPERLMRALRRSHSVVTAWVKGSLVGLGNAQAVSFYRKCGFKRAGKTDSMWVFRGREHG